MIMETLAFSGQGPEMPDVLQCSRQSFTVKTCPNFTWFQHIPLDIHEGKSSVYNFLSPESNYFTDAFKVFNVPQIFLEGH